MNQTMIGYLHGYYLWEGSHILFSLPYLLSIFQLDRSGHLVSKAWGLVMVSCGCLWQIKCQTKREAVLQERAPREAGKEHIPLLKCHILHPGWELWVGYATETYSNTCIFETPGTRHFISWSIYTLCSSLPLGRETWQMAWCKFLTAE